MDIVHPPRCNNINGLVDGPLGPYVDAFKQHLTDRGYAAHTFGSYVGGIAHFAQWIHGCRLRVQRIDEEVVAEFLDDHLARCRCAGPVRHDRRDLSAALGHLLVVLRAQGAIAAPTVSTTPVDDELRRYDDYMDHVRGLAPKTREMALRIARRLLTARFADGCVDIPAIKPEHIRRFFAQQAKLYGKPVNTGTVVSALRGYFRYRASLGDAVHGLIGAVSYPANWQLASLPKTLTAEEVEQLVASLGKPGHSMRRADAIVRCALDLGLRSGEVARISLDDIDWSASTITLRHTKGRREDVLPLPASTGKAIATYLKLERPKTRNRAVFVRHVAPRDEPVAPDLVRKTIRQAYARAGLPYTRSHLLRHTMANRLLASGSSLKEVADVLRHRSLNTTLIYAKLDKAKEMKPAKASKAEKGKPVQKVLHEDDRVRVTETTSQPGDVSASVVRGFRVVRYLKGGTQLRTYADGKTEKIERKTGEVFVAEPDKQAYSIKNAGKTAIVTYVVNIKEPKK